MFCPNCGKKVNDFDNFCKFCGHDLREASTENYIKSEQIRQETFCMPEAEERRSVVPVKQIEPEEIIKKDEKIDENDNEYDEENEIVVFEIKKTLYVYVLAVCVFSDIYRVFLDFLCQYPQLFRLYNCADISCADYLPDFALLFGQKRYYNFKPSYKTRCFYC